MDFLCSSRTSYDFLRLPIGPPKIIAGYPAKRRIDLRYERGCTLEGVEQGRIHTHSRTESSWRVRRGARRCSESRGRRLGTEASKDLKHWSFGEGVDGQRELAVGIVYDNEAFIKVGGA